jgi:hypothetical protein
MIFPGNGARKRRHNLASRTRTMPGGAATVRGGPRFDSLWEICFFQTFLAGTTGQHNCTINHIRYSARAVVITCPRTMRDRRSTIRRTVGPGQSGSPRNSATSIPSGEGAEPLHTALYACKLPTPYTVRVRTAATHNVQQRLYLSRRSSGPAEDIELLI